MEMADLVIVTKCDGHLRQAARHAVADLRRALQLHRPKHSFWQVSMVAGVDGLIDRVACIFSPKSSAIRHVSKMDRRTARNRPGCVDGLVFELRQYLVAGCVGSDDTIPRRKQGWSC